MKRKTKKTNKTVDVATILLTALLDLVVSLIVLAIDKLT